jgi:hypothetical protein
MWQVQLAPFFHRAREVVCWFWVGCCGVWWAGRVRRPRSAACPGFSWVVVVMSGRRQDLA